VAVGAIFGLEALSTYKEAEDACGGAHVHCPASSASKYDTASTQANVANAAIGLGIVAVAVGSYLLVSARPAPGTGHTSVAAVAPWLGIGGGGAALAGHF
jgi:hypothetical protein